MTDIANIPIVKMLKDLKYITSEIIRKEGLFSQENLKDVSQIIVKKNLDSTVSVTFVGGVSLCFVVDNRDLIIPTVTRVRAKDYTSLVALNTIISAFKDFEEGRIYSIQMFKEYTFLEFLRGDGCMKYIVINVGVL